VVFAVASGFAVCVVVNGAALVGRGFTGGVASNGAPEVSFERPAAGAVDALGVTEPAGGSGDGAEDAGFGEGAV